MRNILLILTFISISISLFADIVPKEIAYKVAKNYYYQAANSLHSNHIKYDDIQLSCIMDAERDQSANLYIFNVNNDSGFIIISSNDNITPVLAYSFESSFNIDNISPSQQNIINYYQSMNAKVEDRYSVNAEKIEYEWKSLSKYSPDQNYKLKSTVEGLLGEIKWNQSMPYNAMCPETDDAYTGYGGRCPVGCSAIAMLQIMKFYNWPFEGTGTYMHSNWDNGGHGNIYVNFGNESYDWFSMPKVGQMPNDELAKTCFHAGVAIKMHWSAEGSGASPEDVLYAMENYFFYENNIDLIYKDDYSEEDWETTLRNQIDNKMPIFYVGYTDEAGHAWNCDGYQGEDHFHMNWGWGGYGNGFYTLDALGTSATPGNSEGNYSQWQHALINIFPDTDFPSYCNGNTLITGTEGSFGDGSAYENYQNNTSCTYVIESSCNQIVLLEFTEFDLAAGDLIQIWDGTPEDNALLATIDGDNHPNIEYEAISGKMTIEFDTDASETSSGWAVDYHTKSCTANKTLTALEGTFDDGSKSCDYSGATLCTWTIEPEEASQILIDFEYYDVGGEIDFVKIYENSISESNVVAAFDNEISPTQRVVVNSGKAILRFFASANSSLGDGWEVTYSANCSSSEQFSLEKLSISPNPGSLDSRIDFKTDYRGTADVCIYNILGELIGKKTVDITQKQNSFAISHFISKSNAGAYIITITTDSFISTYNFVLAD